MFRLTMVALFAATSVFAADSEPAKKHELKAEFNVPSSSEKAAITEKT